MGDGFGPEMLRRDYFWRWTYIFSSVSCSILYLTPRYSIHPLIAYSATSVYDVLFLSLWPFPPRPSRRSPTWTSCSVTGQPRRRTSPSFGTFGIHGWAYLWMDLDATPFWSVQRRCEGSSTSADQAPAATLLSQTYLKSTRKNANGPSNQMLHQDQPATIFINLCLSLPNYEDATIPSSNQSVWSGDEIARMCCCTNQSVTSGQDQGR